MPLFALITWFIKYNLVPIAEVLELELITQEALITLEADPTTWEVVCKLVDPKSICVPDAEIELCAFIKDCASLTMLPSLTTALVESTELDPRST